MLVTQSLFAVCKSEHGVSIGYNSQHSWFWRGSYRSSLRQWLWKRKVDAANVLRTSKGLRDVQLKLFKEESVEEIHITKALKLKPCYYEDLHKGSLYFFFYFVWPSGPLFILLWKYSRAIRTVIIVSKVSFSVHTLPQRAPLKAYTLSFTTTTWSTLLWRAFRVSYLSIRSWKFRILAISCVRPERCLSHHLHKKLKLDTFTRLKIWNHFLWRRLGLSRNWGGLQVH